MKTKKISPENKRGYVEVVIGFNGDGKLANASGNFSEVPGGRREPIDLILILVREILQKNHGTLVIESNDKRPKTLITLRFPIERRNVVYYAPITV